MTSITELLELAKTDAGKDQLRVMLAELVGWKRDGKWGIYPQWLNPQGEHRYGQQYDHLSCVPDYPRDLNACHEVEMTLTGKQQNEFIRWLHELIIYTAEVEHRVGIPQDARIWICLHSTATQRTIALILTLQKP